MKTKIKSLNILLFGCFFFLGTKPNNAQEVEDESLFNYNPNSKKGPLFWGEINEEWGACNNGTVQSPIDLANMRVRIITKPDHKNYTASNATLLNREAMTFKLSGILEMVDQFPSIGQITISYRPTGTPLPSTLSVAKDAHSCSRANMFDMELHLVHLNTDPNVTNKIAVVGVFYKISKRKPDKFLSKLMSNISSIMDHNHTGVNIGVIDPNDIKIRGKECFRYIGSLTVPPCTEGVIWTINTKVRTVSSEQVKLLREAVYAEENARPLQSNHKQDVYF